MLTCSRLPPLYRRAEHLHNECGPYQMQAVLSAYEKPAIIQELYVSEWHRKLDYTLPWDVKKLLEERGIESRVKFWKKKSFFDNAIAELKKDHPIVFVLRSIRGNRRLHWGSIWGFDEENDSFLVYDSQAEQQIGGVGNTSYLRVQVENSLPWLSTYVLPIQGIITAH